PIALERIRGGLDHVVEVTDDEIEDAMRAIYDDTHNVAEGAAASSLAALLREKDKIRGRDVAIVLTGANVDAEIFSRALGTPCRAGRDAGDDPRQLLPAALREALRREPQLRHQIGPGDRERELDAAVGDATHAQPVEHHCLSAGREREAVHERRELFDGHVLLRGIISNLP